MPRTPVRCLWAGAVVVAVIALVGAVGSASAASRPVVGAAWSAAVALPARASGAATGSEPGLVIGSEPVADGSVPGGAVARGPRGAAAVGTANDPEAVAGVTAQGMRVHPTVGSAAGALAGGAETSAAELALDPASETARVAPWIVLVLLVGVVAGSVRSYARSPQREAFQNRNRRSVSEVEGTGVERLPS